VRSAASPFAKLEALGNDFVLIDARDRDLELTPTEIVSWPTATAASASTSC
jgi:diaminopimelate epimerase